MRTRESLQKKLEDLLKTRNVYFQPPEGFKMKYPCITYNLNSLGVRHADNKAYFMMNRYDLTIIDKDPNSPIIRKLMNEFELISFDRTFINDNLNHFIFTLYY